MQRLQYAQASFSTCKGILINYQAHSKQLEINYLINDDVPKYIWVDYIRLKQILINLLTNAIKFTHVGSINLTIAVLEVHKSQTTLQFSVKDTGIGINQDKQEIISNSESKIIVVFSRI